MQQEQCRQVKGAARLCRWAAPGCQWGNAGRLWNDLRWRRIHVRWVRESNVCRFLNDGPEIARPWIDIGLRQFPNYHRFAIDVPYDRSGWTKGTGWVGLDHRWGIIFDGWVDRINIGWILLLQTVEKAALSFDKAGQILLLPLLLSLRFRCGRGWFARLIIVNSLAFAVAVAA